MEEINDEFKSRQDRIIRNRSDKAEYALVQGKYLETYLSERSRAGEVDALPNAILDILIDLQHLAKRFKNDLQLPQVAQRAHEIFQRERSE